MRINRAIRADKVRVIGKDGKQQGVMLLQEAQKLAEREGLDLVEIAPNAQPPVCKIVDYGKFRYQQTKKEKENKKQQHLIKVKEIKLKPNIDKHDLETKIKRAKEFLLKGNKVKVTCMFRGREMLHLNLGEKVMNEIKESLADVAQAEQPPKQLGKIMLMVLAPIKEKQKKNQGENSGNKNENA